jgi:hypothetical protein
MDKRVQVPRGDRVVIGPGQSVAFLVLESPSSRYHLGCAGNDANFSSAFSFLLFCQENIRLMGLWP